MIALLLALACGSERLPVKTLRDAPELPGRTMIIEFPHPGCASSPAVADVFKRARAQFAAFAGAGSPPPSPRFYQLPQPIPVAVAGVVFLDHPHGQVGRAPKNDVELHPVTWISRRAR
jgi:hypothetical protein